nr:hypothetical protein [uncultured Campylobacter sp.]
MNEIAPFALLPRNDGILEFPSTEIPRSSRGMTSLWNSRIPREF